MAFGTPQWGISSSPGVTPFTKQPNYNVEAVATAENSHNDFSIMRNGYDRAVLRWGFGEAGSIDHATLLAFINIFEACAANGGKGYLNDYSYETDGWVERPCVVQRPVWRMAGSDGTGPRGFDVVWVVTELDRAA